MRKFNVSILSLSLLLTFASCFKKTNEVKDQKITVLSSRGLHLIQPLLKEFSKETGIKVEASNNKVGVFFSLLKNNSVKADLLLTTDLGSLVKASNDGLLQPVSFKKEADYPIDYVSPKLDWFGLSMRTRVIFYNPKHDLAKKYKLVSYGFDGIADEKFKNTLCMRTSQKVYNQALVADLVERFGEDKALSIVKGWVNNLAAPVFASDREVIKAVSKGKCLFGIANSYYLGKMEEKSDLENVRILWSIDSPAHVNLSGVGLLKDAPNKEGAEKLMKWLMQDKAQALFASLNFEYPVKPNVSVNELINKYGSPRVYSPEYLKNYESLHKTALSVIKNAGYK